MYPSDIFLEGWWKIVIMYAVVFYLAIWAVYKIIFRSLIGQPSSYTIQDLRFFRRKVTVASAVFFAPIFEEIMFTFLAYASFLKLAQPGKEGIVVLLVAAFFALLHFPGDWFRLKNGPRGIDFFYLLILQFSRFFYSLAAYFLYLKTDLLFFSIVLHYFANGITSIYNFDAQDGVKGTSDWDYLALLIIGSEIGFCAYANYYFYWFYPELSFGLMLAGVFFIFGFFNYSRRWARS